MATSPDSLTALGNYWNVAVLLVRTGVGLGFFSFYLLYALFDSDFDRLFFVLLVFPIRDVCVRPYSWWMKSW